MYKIIGADGNEYGPVNLDQLRQWIAQGRVNTLTRVRPEGAADWKTAAELPELSGAFTARSAGAAPPLAASPIAAVAGPPQSGLATTSLVLGILSLVCFGFLAGIPAIICGHIARRRARAAPAQFGGAGAALAGLILGYVSLVLTFVVLPAMLLPALARAKAKAQEISCANNMKQIGLAFKTWAIDNNDHFPFNVATTNGGTLELCAPGPDGFDKNPAPHFLVMSNELFTPRVLVCPQDASKTAADTWQDLGPANISYQVHVGPEVDDAHPEEVLARCPVHGTVVLCDGAVQRQPRRRR